MIIRDRKSIPVFVKHCHLTTSNMIQDSRSDFKWHLLVCVPIIYKAPPVVESSFIISTAYQHFYLHHVRIKRLLRIFTSWLTNQLNLYTRILWIKWISTLKNSSPVKNPILFPQNSVETGGKTIWFTHVSNVDKEGFKQVYSSVNQYIKFRQHFINLILLIFN